MESPLFCRVHSAVRILQLLLGVAILVTASFLLNYRVQAHSNINNEPLVLVIAGAIAFLYSMWVLLSYRRLRSLTLDARRSRNYRYHPRQQYPTEQQEQQKQPPATESQSVELGPLQLGSTTPSSRPHQFFTTPPSAPPSAPPSPPPSPRPRTSWLRGLFSSGQDGLCAPEDQGLPMWRMCLHAFCVLVIMAILAAGATVSLAMSKHGVPCQILKDGRELGEGYIPMGTLSLSPLGVPNSPRGFSTASDPLNSLQSQPLEYEKDGAEERVSSVVLSRRSLPKYQPGMEYGPDDMCQNVYMNLDYACAGLSCIAAVLWGLDFVYIIRAIVRRSRSAKKSRIADGYPAGHPIPPPLPTLHQQQRPRRPTSRHSSARGQSYSGSQTSSRMVRPVDLGDDDNDDEYFQESMEFRHSRDAPPPAWMERDGLELPSGTQQDYQVVIPVASGDSEETADTLLAKSEAEGVAASQPISVSPSVNAALLPVVIPPTHVEPVSPNETERGSPSRSRSRTSPSHPFPYLQEPPHHSRSRSPQSVAASQRERSEETIPSPGESTVVTTPVDTIDLAPFPGVVRVPLDQETAERDRNDIIATTATTSADLDTASIKEEEEEEEDMGVGVRVEPGDFDLFREQNNSDNSIQLQEVDKGCNNNRGYIYLAPGPACYAFNSAGGDFQPSYVNMAARRQRYQSSPSYISTHSSPRPRSRSRSRTRAGAPVGSASSPTTPTTPTSARPRPRTLPTGTGVGSSSSSSNMTASRALDSPRTPTSMVQPSSPAREQQQQQQLLDRIEMDPYDYVVCKKLPPNFKPSAVRSQSTTTTTQAVPSHLQDGQPLRKVSSASSLTSPPLQLPSATAAAKVAPINPASTASGSIGRVDMPTTMQPNLQRSLSSRRAKTGTTITTNAGPKPLTINTNLRSPPPSSRVPGPLSAPFSSSVARRASPSPSSPSVAALPLTADPLRRTASGTRTTATAVNVPSSSTTPSSITTSTSSPLTPTTATSVNGRPLFEHHASRTSLNSMQYRGDI